MQQQLEDIKAALAGPATQALPKQLESAEHTMLWALYGSSRAWRELGLDGYDGRCLYLGISGHSTFRRDLLESFGRWPAARLSPLRRTLAALLRETDAPSLSNWMETHLSVAWCAYPHRGGGRHTLDALLRDWQPPLNRNGYPNPWLERVRAALRAGSS